MIEFIWVEDRSLYREKLKEIVREDSEILHLNTNSSHFTFDRVYEYIETVSLFVEHKVLILEIENLKKELENRLLQLLKHPLDSVDLYLVFFDKLRANNPLKKASLKYAQHTIKQYSDQMIRKDLNHVLSHINIDSHLQKELENRVLKQIHDYPRIKEKLLLMDEMDAEDLEQIVPKHFSDNVFDFSNAILSKDLDKAYNLFMGFRKQNIDALSLIPLLASNYRRIFQISALLDQGHTIEQISECLYISSKQVYYLARNQKTDPLRLIPIIHSLYEIEKESKQGNVDQNLSMELFIIEHCEYKKK